MNADNELLALAAKAAGRAFVRMSDYSDRTPDHWVSEVAGCWQNWDPLNDDGDALRLAVRLNMTVSVERRVIEVEYYLDGSVFAVEEDGEKRAKNPFIATRRAIVLAAAEIGKATP